MITRVVGIFLVIAGLFCNNWRVAVVGLSVMAF